MFKYVLKRIGYMFLVLFILSIVIFMIYNLTPSNRAYTDAKADQVAMKQQLAGMSAEAQAKWFEERYEMYQISYGTETNNMILRYLRWVGLYPYADNPYTGKEGKLNGLLQGNFGYSYQYKKDVVNVVAAPMKNTIFINIFATILALAITIPLGIACAVRKNSKFDRFTQVFTIIGYSLPSFIICVHQLDRAVQKLADIVDTSPYLRYAAVYAAQAVHRLHRGPRISGEIMVFSIRS